MVDFVLKIHQKLVYFEYKIDYIWKTKYQKIYDPFVSAHSARFMQDVSQLRICSHPPSEVAVFTWKMRMYWNWWKIIFQILAISIFRVMMKIHRKLIIFSTKMTITRKIKSEKFEIWYFFGFSTFCIFHVNLATFEKKMLSMNLSIWLKRC